MSAIQEFYNEAKRIKHDVQQVVLSYRKCRCDGDDFDTDLQKAFGDSGGRDLKAEAMRSTSDPDIRQRIESVQKTLAYFCSFAYSGVADEGFNKCSFAMREALEALEPFVDQVEWTEWKRVADWRRELNDMPETSWKRFVKTITHERDGHKVRFSLEEFKKAQEKTN